MSKAGPFRKSWNTYRQTRSAIGLVQDALNVIGWKKGIIAFVTAGFAAFASIMTRASTGGQMIAIFCCSFLVALLIVVGTERLWMFLRSLHHKGANVPVLAYGGWHSGSDLHPRTLPGGRPSWVRIKNTSVERPTAANNVRIKVEWNNDAGTSSLMILEAEWYLLLGNRDERSTTSWTRNVNLEGGDEQSFVLFLSDDQSQKWTCKDGDAAGKLEPGHWTALITVTSDNGEGFEGRLGFTIHRDLSIDPDEPTAFHKTRRLAPRI